MVKKTDLGPILEGHPFFDGMDEGARKLIVGCAKNAVFHDDDMVYKEGAAADTFYLIRHGSIALEVHTPAREPLVIETLSNGEILGWSWLVPPYRCRFDARAIGVVRAIAIDAKCLRGKCEKDHSLGYQFYKQFLPVISSRLGAARLQMIDMYGDPIAYAQKTQAVEKDTLPAKPTPGKVKKAKGKKS
ncbi:MAG: cyclic nucleotide-binding domain-containing protein [Rhodospirillales bacterium]|nr:cyclic nucleotide-binding domain-containing protein [Rhodospirillales bacterium]